MFWGKSFTSEVLGWLIFDYLIEETGLIEEGELYCYDGEAPTISEGSVFYPFLFETTDGIWS